MRDIGFISEVAQDNFNRQFTNKIWTTKWYLKLLQIWDEFLKYIYTRSWKFDFT